MTHSPCETCPDVCCNRLTIEVLQPQLSEAQFYDYIDWVGRRMGVTIGKVNVDCRLFEMTIMTPCKYLAGGRCTDYEHRPTICRLYTCKRMSK
jgi:Fe-S-cluster containining protein